MSVRAICIDLDGTLLNKEKTVSEYSKEILRSALDKGIKVIIVTGRPYCFARYIADLIDSRVETISFNGGTYKIDNEYKHYYIDDSLQEIITILEESNSNAYYKTMEEIYSNNDPDHRVMYDYFKDIPNTPKINSYCNLDVSELRNIMQNVIKVIVINENIDEIKRLVKVFSNISEISVSTYNPISLEIFKKDVSKGNAIVEYMENNNIALEDVMAFGDSDNDISMFEEVGHKVAMANANEYLKSLADDITQSNLDDGVAKYIKKIL